MSVDAERAAWADYWTSAGGASPACLPNASHGVEAAQRSVWAGFAQTLPRRAKVLDIGTGDGAVLAALAIRRDLDLTGVDNAPTLPRPPKGVRLMANVAAEQLPFPARRFDAIVGQFGFEYADTGRAAAEASRVMRDEAAIQLIVHHRDGPIVAHNRSRRSALQWAIGEHDLIGRARALVAARRVARLPTPDGFRLTIREAQLRFGPGTGADELAEAVWRTLEDGRFRAEAEVTNMLATLSRRADAEIVRIESLLRAACDEQEIAGLGRQLEAAGIAVSAPAPLFVDRVAQPFAWLIGGRKTSAAA